MQPLRSFLPCDMYPGNGLVFLLTTTSSVANSARISYPFADSRNLKKRILEVNTNLPRELLIAVMVIKVFMIDSIPRYCVCFLFLGFTVTDRNR